jgi:DNA-binding NtrC family response regulator
MSDEERALLEGAGQLAFANPFEATGVTVDKHPLAARLVPLLDRLGPQIAAGAPLSDAERTLYVEACLHTLRVAHEPRLQPLVEGQAGDADTAARYRDFAAEHRCRLLFPDRRLDAPPPEQLFAFCFQLRRAFHHLSSTVIGASAPAASLRADLWRAIVTHDLRRYLRTCGRRRMDVSTLLIGETGTGKELAARAIGLSAFAAFDPKSERFVADAAVDFRAVNLAALPESLFESELFGHERGSFTGAVKERKGLFAACGPDGVLFLDEIGALAPARQVTLLRVLEARRFARVGDLEEQVFSARIVAAAQPDLAAQIHAGAFRRDLYERLAAIKIVTPTLRVQLEAAPGERRALVRFFAAQRVDPDEVEALTAEVESFIEAHLPRYPWPGNVRELKRCVESVYSMGQFAPMDLPAAEAANDDDPLRSIRALPLSEDEVVRRYASMVFEETGERHDETARVLGVNRKTVARRLDHAWLARRGVRRAR